MFFHVEQVGKEKKSKGKRPDSVTTQEQQYKYWPTTVITFVAVVAFVWFVVTSYILAQKECL